MNIELEKKQIIDELKHVHDEWLLKAIKRLLGLDYEEEIPAEHKQILNSRLKSFDAGHSETLDWEEAKKRLGKNQ
jgi:hypothetical protein